MPVLAPCHAGVNNNCALITQTVDKPSRRMHENPCCPWNFNSLFEYVHGGMHALLEAHNSLADWYLGTIASAVIDALANFGLQQTW